VILAVAGRVERHDDCGVGDEEHRAARLRRVPTPDGGRCHDEAEGEGCDLHFPEPERQRLDEPREQGNSGDQEDGDLRRRRQRDLCSELDLSPPGDDDRASVLGRVPDDRDDHRRDEEVREPELLGERLERADEDLGHERRHDRGRAEDDQGSLERPGLDLLVACDVQLAVAAEGKERHHDVDEEEHDRDRNRELNDEVPVGIAVPGRHRRDEEEQHRDGDRAEREEARETVELVAWPCNEREAEHEQEVPHHRAGERAAHDLGQALVHRDERDDQLGSVPERRVEKAADPRARALGGVLGRFADEPRQGDERKGREHELDRLVEVEGVMDDDRERPEQQAGEEGAADHGGGTLVSPR